MDAYSGIIWGQINISWFDPKKGSLGGNIGQLRGESLNKLYVLDILFNYYSVQLTTLLNVL